MAAEAEASREARAKVWTLTQEMSSFSVVANDSEMSIRTGCACGCCCHARYNVSVCKVP